MRSFMLNTVVALELNLYCTNIFQKQKLVMKIQEIIRYFPSFRWQIRHRKPGPPWSVV